MENDRGKWKQKYINDALTPNIYVRIVYTYISMRK